MSPTFPESPILPTPGIPDFRRRLLAWFEARARDLPWRKDTDPYRVWVSEVMLQQTRVEAVIPYYLRWMERFPTVELLATAPEEEVLGAWAGLGYYSRARNLHRAAQVVRERHGGRLPSDPQALRALPGVGDYTAGAVGSIAFRLPLPAVDGNVRRVLARLADEPDPTATVLRSWAGGLMDPERPGDFNQALMELGATICTPWKPACGVCPVSPACQARANGTQGERPIPRRKGPVREASWGVAVLVAGRGDASRVLVRRRPSSGLLAGMWEFPSSEVGGEPGAEGELEAALMAAAGAYDGGDLGVEPGAGWPLPPVPHLFSHIRAVYHPFLWAAEASPAQDPERPDAPRWILLHGQEAPPLPVAQQRILELARKWMAGGGRPGQGRQGEGGRP